MTHLTTNLNQLNKTSNNPPSTPYHHISISPLQNSLEANIHVVNTLLATLEDYIVLLDAEGFLVAWNRDLTSLVGDSMLEMEGTTAADDDHHQNHQETGSSSTGESKNNNRDDQQSATATATATPSAAASSSSSSSSSTKSHHHRKVSMGGGSGGPGGGSSTGSALDRGAAGGGGGGSSQRQHIFHFLKETHCLSLRQGATHLPIDISNYLSTHS